MLCSYNENNKRPLELRVGWVSWGRGLGLSGFFGLFGAVWISVALGSCSCQSTANMARVVVQLSAGLGRYIDVCRRSQAAGQRRKRSASNTRKRHATLIRSAARCSALRRLSRERADTRCLAAAPSTTSTLPHFRALSHPAVQSGLHRKQLQTMSCVLPRVDRLAKASGWGCSACCGHTWQARDVGSRFSRLAAGAAMSRDKTARRQFPVGVSCPRRGGRRRKQRQRRRGHQGT